MAVLPFGLALLAMGTAWSVTTGTIFMYDDFGILHRFAAKSVAGIFTIHGDHFLPVFNLLFFLEYKVFGFWGMWGFGMVNLALHLINVVLLARLLSRFVSRKGIVICASVFIGVNTAFYVILVSKNQQSNTLSVVFLLLSLLTVQSYLEHKKPWMYGVSVLCAGLSALSFGTGLLTPVILIFYVMLMGPLKGRPFPSRSNLRLWSGYGLVFIACLALYAVAQHLGGRASSLSKLHIDPMIALTFIIHQVFLTVENSLGFAGVGIGSTVHTSYFKYGHGSVPAAVFWLGGSLPLLALLIPTLRRKKDVNGHIPEAVRRFAWFALGAIFIIYILIALKRAPAVVARFHPVQRYNYLPMLLGVAALAALIDSGAYGVLPRFSRAAKRVAPVLLVGFFLLHSTQIWLDYKGRLNRSPDKRALYAFRDAFAPIVNGSGTKGNHPQELLESYIMFTGNPYRELLLTMFQKSLDNVRWVRHTTEEDAARVLVGEYPYPALVDLYVNFAPEKLINFVPVSFGQADPDLNAASSQVVEVPDDGASLLGLFVIRKPVKPCRLVVKLYRLKSPSGMGDLPTLRPDPADRRLQGLPYLHREYSCGAVRGSAMNVFDLGEQLSQGDVFLVVLSQKPADDGDYFQTLAIPMKDSNRGYHLSSDGSWHPYEDEGRRLALMLGLLDRVEMAGRPVPYLQSAAKGE